MNQQNLYHLGFNPEAIRASYAILPGDPGRVESIASYFTDAEPIAYQREFNVWRGFTDDSHDHSVLICSTGIGGPSAAIAVEELHMAGVQNFLRVGTCGAMQTEIQSGELVIAQSAVRQEGTALHYAPIEYPATADFEITAALKAAAKQIGIKSHIGVVQCKDSFYGQHDPNRMPVGYELSSKWDAWKRLGVLASEMESATIFTAAAALGCKAGCVLHVVWNQERAAAGLDNPEIHDTAAAVKCAALAVKLLAAQEKGSITSSVQR